MHSHLLSHSTKIIEDSSILLSTAHPLVIPPVGENYLPVSSGLPLLTLLAFLIIILVYTCVLFKKPIKVGL